MKPPVNIFGAHYREKYGEPVAKIALDTGILCPNRQKGGCVFCRQDSFMPYYMKNRSSFEGQLEEGRAHLKARGVGIYFAYFQQETPTAAPLPQLMSMVSLALQDPQCIGIIISTRPDYVQASLLKELSETVVGRAKRELLIELGLQSMYEATLEMLNRNHTFDDFVDAARLIRRFPDIQLGVHLILGLPGEDFNHMRLTVMTVADMGINYVKLHHLQILKDTRLLSLYGKSPFRLYTAEEYLELLAELLPCLPYRVVVHRLCNTTSPDLIAYPQWNMNAGALYVALVKLMTERGLVQGKEVDRDENE
ncbi:MAG: TIGR01212 family radical SAM protein [Pseudomonadota bacterium]